MLDGTEPAIWTALWMNGDARSLRIAPWAPLIETYERGERTRVVVHGDIDIDVTCAFHEALRATLDRSVAGLDLELAPLRFCDGAGLRVLLTVREAALEAGKTVHSSASSLVARLLHITRTDTLFSATAATGTATGRSPIEAGVPAHRRATPCAANSRTDRAP
ncbi:STAS domain-containing protein [Streptomyces sp. NBC_01465]|uniref:STAS domain-containing protein n=1 Tax=Streptomyces sp. NBC_01465 TaxID=2903878 RepID=UPI002E32F463|nr:STAS domain-containing protein [Streptomyces sp. NBC_01465]